MLVRTLPGASRAFLAVLLLSTTSRAFQVSPSSPCTSQCTIEEAVDTNTTGIACADADFATTVTGLTFKSCIECLQKSSYFSGTDTDVGWFLYNLRFATDVCLFRYPGADVKNETLACNDDYVCRPLANALEADVPRTADSSQLDYCTADSSAFGGQSRTTCIGCLQGSRTNTYLSNFLMALEAGCEQKPLPGRALELSGSLFSQQAINITGAAAHAAGTDVGDSKSKTHLSVGAIVGIAVGAVALFLIGIALLLLYYCNQRRYNKEDRARRASYASYMAYPTYPLYPGENTEIALQGPSYTMDYKSATQDAPGADGGSESSYNKGSAAPQSHPSVHSRQLSQEELQRSPSAMPIHPAYVPRAMMRQNSPPTVAPSHFSSTPHSRNPSFDSPPPIALSAPPLARRPSRARGADSGNMHVSSHSGSESISSVASFSQRRERQTPVPLTLNNPPSLETDIHHKAVRQLEQHGIYAADQQSQQQQQQQQQQQPSPNHQPLPSFSAGPGPAVTSSRARASSISSSKSSPSNPPNLIQPLPLHASSRSSRSGRPQPVHLTLTGNNPTTNSKSPRSQQQQQQKTPPFQHHQLTPPFQTKRSDAPLPGMEDIEISGPLAFPDENPRFRERGPVPPEQGVGTTMGHGTVGPGAARFVDPRHRGATAEQNFIRKGWVAEVPLESERDDLW